jgi:hypothetical protein
MRSPIRAGLGRSFLALIVAAAAVSSCRVAARTGPEPVVASLTVRNPSAFEVNVYALAGPTAKPTWLGTIGAGRSGALPVPRHALGDANALTIQTRAVGASAAWTSEPLPVVEGQMPVLDVVANATGNSSGSALYSVTTIDFEMFMR